MWKWFCALAVLTVVIIGCASNTGERLKRFFFEVPDQTAEAPASIPAQNPTKDETAAKKDDTLVLPEPQFVSVHPPFADHECDACHNMAKRMEVPEDTADTCGQCHEDFFDEDLVKHEIVADGDCLQCHQPHRSKFPKLLTEALPALCTECHDMDDLSEEAHSGKDVGNCIACHDAHFGANHLLKEKKK